MGGLDDQNGHGTTWHPSSDLYCSAGIYEKTLLLKDTNGKPLNQKNGMMSKNSKCAPFERISGFFVNSESS